jgi:hypothetical protein
LSLERLSFSEKEGKVCYRYGKEAKDLECTDYEEKWMLGYSFSRHSRNTNLMSFQKWIEALQNGENPFLSEVLERPKYLLEWR